MAPAQRIGGGARRRISQHSEHEHLGVPEGVAVVTGSGQTLGGNRALLAAGAGLESMKEAEADCLLQLRVALELDVRSFPEAVQILALLAQQALPPRV